MTARSEARSLACHGRRRPIGFVLLTVFPMCSPNMPTISHLQSVPRHVSMTRPVLRFYRPSTPLATVVDVLLRRSSLYEAELGRYGGSVGGVGGGDATPVRMRRRPGVHGPRQGLVGVRLWVTAGDPCSCVAGERRPQERGTTEAMKTCLEGTKLLQPRRREFEAEHRRGIGSGSARVRQA